MQWLKLGVAGVALALALSACGGGGGATPSGQSSQQDTAIPVGKDVIVNSDGSQTLRRGEAKPGGVLRVGLTAAAESLDPAGAVSVQSLIMRQIYDSLFIYDEKGNVRPELAESMETTDDGLTWIMKLPAGVKFTDGTDFNSQAVVAHVTRVGGEGSLARSAGDVRQIAGMETPDPTTVKFTLKKANMTFPKIFVNAAVLSAGMIPSPTAVQKYGKEYGLNPVGVGPFKVKQFSAGGDVILERNPDYRIKGQPLLDGIHFVVAADTQSRLQAVIAGDLDVGSTQNGRDLAAATAGGLVSTYQPDGTFYNLLMNLEKPPFDNPTFRKAVAHAIDRQALVDIVFDGKATAMDGFFPKSNPYHVDSGFPAYDPAAAKRLADEYKAGGGTPEFTLTVVATPDYQRMAQLIQQMLADAGITIQLRMVDQPTSVTEGLSGNFQAQMRFIEVRAEVDQNMRTQFYSTSRGNNGRKGDARVDQILDELQTRQGQEKKEELYTELQAAMADWTPQVPLVAHRLGWYLGKNVAVFPGNRPGGNDPDWRLVAHA